MVPIGFLTAERLRLSPFIRIAAILATLALGGGCLQAAAQVSPEKTVRQALAERLLSGEALSSMREQPIPPETVRDIVRDNIDSTLLTSATQLAGTDFRFVAAGQQAEAQVALLTLVYSGEKTASRMAESLEGGGNYFRRSKILIPFSWAAAGNRLVIAFTENAGNDAVVHFVKEVPRLVK